jgi:predicted glycogen debranching enzyme
MAPRAPRGAAPGDAPPEWLVTNGLGGYAFGCVDGVPRRRHHGVLVAALPAPRGRTVLVHTVEEWADLGHAGTVPLQPASGDGTSFALVAGLPVWTFALGPGLAIERSLVMPHGQNTVHLRYRLLDAPGPLRLTIRPWLDVRAHNSTLIPRAERRFEATSAAAGRVEVRVDDGLAIRFAPSGATARFEHEALDREQVPLVVERDRGYDWLGSACAFGTWPIVLHPGHPAFFTITAADWSEVDALPPDAAWDVEIARRERLLAASDAALHSLDTSPLAWAADQFLIRPVARPEDTVRARAAGTESRSVVAGYPWFTDWGRDTMISLEGLALVTGRATEARQILLTFARHVRDGLIPNLFPEGAREGLYHTADATLWFFHAIDRYEAWTDDQTLAADLLDVLVDIVEAHRAGTRYGIGVAADGLLTQGAPDLPLTWMDARMDGWVVTPRRGKAVEINALWHNALWLLYGWLGRAGHRALAEQTADDARRCQLAFNERFWNGRRGCLFDVVDGDGGDDPACRPNQLFAIGLRYPPLDPARWSAVIDTAVAELLTPMGLRTLSPADPAYQPIYYGALRARDAAYHQGTVWPWLVGPFVDAWIKVHPDDAVGAGRLIDPLLDHVMSAGCLGSVSEIFDPEPPYTSRGCVAQAWSVAELARVAVRLRRASN